MLDSRPHPSAILKVEGLYKAFQRPRGARFWSSRAPTVAVDRISFEIGTGETLALVGESGSGKSTTARCVMRLLSITAGRIAFDGMDITHLAGRDLRNLRRQIQIVFQDPKRSFDPRLRLRTSLLEPLRVHGLRVGDRLGEALDRVGMDQGYLRRFPHELSGGELQRMAIARALILRPRLIVLDEPVSALDVSVQAQITGLLRELQASMAVSYLFIAHDLAVVRELAHRVAVMRAGRIVELKSTSALFAEPDHSYTRDLIAASIVPGWEAA